MPGSGSTHPGSCLEIASSPCTNFAAYAALDAGIIVKRINRIKEDFINFDGESGHFHCRLSLCLIQCDRFRGWGVKR